MNSGARGVKVTPWRGDTEPTEDAMENRLAAEDLSAYAWSNAPGDRYAAHEHNYDKVIYVVRGSITFGVPATGESTILNVGDRLDLPAGTRHEAMVGPHGVVCLEAHRPAR